MATKQAWSWALYDAGNSAFATIVMAGFFPVFFKTCWADAAEVTASTAKLGFANTAAGIAIALLAPLLGAAADRGMAKKKFLCFFTLLGAGATALLGYVPCGLWTSATACYVIASIGFSGGIIFYDSLLPTVAADDGAHRVSSLGFALGYLGGGLVFAGCIVAASLPELFGGAREGAVRASFVVAGAWWLALSVPLFLHVPEPRCGSPRPLARSIREGCAQLCATLGQVRGMKNVWLFLLAYWFYIDGVDTVIKMAIDYGMSLGLSPDHLVRALLITQFVGFPCALLFGTLAARWGAKRALYVGIGAYVVIVLWGMAMRTEREFYALAVLVGMVQGGVQAISRSFFSELIPRERAAEFFGFYNMVGKYSAIFGPALLAASAYLTRSPRAGIASLLLFFIVGGLLLSCVRTGQSPVRGHVPGKR